LALVRRATRRSLPQRKRGLSLPRRHAIGRKHHHEGTKKGAANG
jgi:hypothetical protein